MGHFEVMSNARTWNNNKKGRIKLVRIVDMVNFFLSNSDSNLFSTFNLSFTVSLNDFS